MELKITPSGQTIVKPTALGPVANTDTKLLILWSISKGPSLGTGRGPIGDIPPTNFEHLYDCRQRSSLSEAGLN